MTNIIMTNAEIEAIYELEYTEPISYREEVPAFLDSITDLEDELDYACESWNEPEVVNDDNIIPFPNTIFDPTDPAGIALVA